MQQKLAHSLMRSGDLLRRKTGCSDRQRNAPERNRGIRNDAVKRNQLVDIPGIGQSDVEVFGRIRSHRLRMSGFALAIMERPLLAQSGRPMCQSLLWTAWTRKPLVRRELPMPINVGQRGSKWSFGGKSAS